MCINCKWQFHWKKWNRLDKQEGNQNCGKDVIVADSGSVPSTINKEQTTIEQRQEAGQENI